MLLLLGSSCLLTAVLLVTYEGADYYRVRASQLLRVRLVITRWVGLSAPSLCFLQQNQNAQCSVTMKPFPITIHQAAIVGVDISSG